MHIYISKPLMSIAHTTKYRRYLHICFARYIYMRKLTCIRGMSLAGE